jgi:hypothetical protein
MIQRKKYKTFVQNWHSPMSPSTEWSWFFVNRTCNVFFIYYAVILLKYSELSFVLNNKILKINSTAWCWWNRLGTRGIYTALFSAIDCEFEPRSGQTKEYTIGICCFSAKHAALKRKSKDWLARNQDNVSEWSDYS